MLTPFATRQKHSPELGPRRQNGPLPAHVASKPRIFVTRHTAFIDTRGQPRRCGRKRVDVVSGGALPSSDGKPPETRPIFRAPPLFRPDRKWRATATLRSTVR